MGTPLWRLVVRGHVYTTPHGPLAFDPARPPFKPGVMVPPAAPVVITGTVAYWIAGQMGATHATEVV